MKILLYSSKRPWTSLELFLMLLSDDQLSICQSTLLCWRFFLNTPRISIALRMTAADIVPANWSMRPVTLLTPRTQCQQVVNDVRAGGFSYPMSSIYEDRIFKGDSQGGWEGVSMLLALSPLAL